MSSFPDSTGLEDLGPHIDTDVSLDKSLLHVSVLGIRQVDERN